jgi:hypothetical protein
MFVTRQQQSISIIRQRQVRRDSDIIMSGGWV